MSMFNQESVFLSDLMAHFENLKKKIENQTNFLWIVITDATACQFYVHQNLYN